MPILRTLSRGTTLIHIFDMHSILLTRGTSDLSLEAQKWFRRSLQKPFTQRFLL